MPRDVELNGIRHEGTLCRMIQKTTHRLDPGCKPLTKVYYVQYQYFPFYIASLGILYYMPYILFRVINSDIISLRGNLKPPLVNNLTAAKIVDRYFTYTGNGGVLILRVRVLATIGIRLSYMLVNIGGFMFTDHLLNEEYTDYGVNWINWAQMNNTMAFDYSGMRGFPKPGNKLLPSMGFCDISEGSKDNIQAVTNQHRFICEISTHILYQYVMIVLWFLFVIGIVISAIGFLQSIGANCLMSVKSVLSHRRETGKANFYRACRKLTLREIEYMKLLRSKNLLLYKEILKSLQGEHV